MTAAGARPTSAAVIGAGFVGAQHIEALRRINVDVAVVAASSEDRARSAAEALCVRGGRRPCQRSRALDRGAGGSATWRQEQPDQLWLARNGTLEVIPRSPVSLLPGARQLARLPAGHNEGWADALRNLLAAAYAIVRGGHGVDEAVSVPIPTFEDGLRHLAFVEAALLSATAGRWVSIDDVLNQQPTVAEVS